MKLLIDAAYGGGYLIHVDDGKGRREICPEIFFSLEDAFANVQYAAEEIERTTGQKVESLFTREAIRQNKDRDTGALTIWNAPSFQRTAAS